MFAAVGPVGESDVFDKISPVVTNAHRDLGDYPYTGGSASADLTLVIVSVVGFIDDSAMGYDYELHLEPSSSGLTIVAATRWTVCSRGATIATTDQPSVCV